jgi:predicted acyl esterase
MALINPHPALKVSVPMNPMVDGWMGDDWFHNGAFRPAGHELHLRPGSDARELRSNGGPATTTTTTCSWKPAQRASSAAARSRAGRLLAQATRASEYDAYWREQAGRQDSREEPLKFPVMLVHSLWDQEDIYGDIACTKRSSRKIQTTTRCFLVLGHGTRGRRFATAARFGAIKFNSDTGDDVSPEILRPFLDHYLKTARQGHTRPVGFRDGTTWHRCPAWPKGCERLHIKPTPLYLRPV